MEEIYSPKDLRKYTGQARYDAEAERWKDTGYNHDTHIATCYICHKDMIITKMPKHLTTKKHISNRRFKETEENREEAERRFCAAI